MSQWQNVGNGMEAKITKKGVLMIRDAGKYPSNDDYPHFSVEFDSKGNIIDFHASDSRFGSRFGRDEVVMMALAFLKGKGML